MAPAPLGRRPALDFACDDIGDEGAWSLAGLLGQSSVLSSLDLGCNDIGGQGAESLAGVLDQCSSLVTLDRWGNIIRAEGARSLAGVLGQCSSLASLNLARNDIEALDDFDMPPTTCTTDHAAGLTPEPISALDRPGLDDDDTGAATTCRRQRKNARKCPSIRAHFITH